MSKIESSLYRYAAGGYFIQYKVMWKITETLAHWYSSESTHESYPMNTNMAGFRWFSKLCIFLRMDERSLSIERVKLHHH